MTAPDVRHRITGARNHIKRYDVIEHDFVDDFLFSDVFGVKMDDATFLGVEFRDAYDSGRDIHLDRIALEGTSIRVDATTTTHVVGGPSSPEVSGWICAIDERYATLPYWEDSSTTKMYVIDVDTLSITDDDVIPSAAQNDEDPTVNLKIGPSDGVLIYTKVQAESNGYIDLVFQPYSIAAGVITFGTSTEVNVKGDYITHGALGPDGTVMINMTYSYYDVVLEEFFSGYTFYISSTDDWSILDSIEIVGAVGWLDSEFGSTYHDGHIVLVNIIHHGQARDSSDAFISDRLPSDVSDFPSVTPDYGFDWPSKTAEWRSFTWQHSHEDPMTLSKWGQQFVNRVSFGILYRRVQVTHYEWTGQLQKVNEATLDFMKDDGFINAFGGLRWQFWAETQKQLISFGKTLIMPVIFVLNDFLFLYELWGEIFRIEPGCVNGSWGKIFFDPENTYLNRFEASAEHESGLGWDGVAERWISNGGEGYITAAMTDDLAISMGTAYEYTTDTIGPVDNSYLTTSRVYVLWGLGEPSYEVTDRRYAVEHWDGMLP